MWRRMEGVKLGWAGLGLDGLDELDPGGFFVSLAWKLVCCLEAGCGIELGNYCTHQRLSRGDLGVGERHCRG